MYKIFIVEDDSVIAEQIGKHLGSWGCDVQSASDLNDVIGEFAEYAPHLVILDISLPFYNGYHWCSEIRKVSKVPIIFLSSSADGMNIVMAMNMGADDFIPKPFDLNVLTAKIQAILRRTYDFAEPAESGVLEHNGIMLNVNDASLSHGDDRMDLTKNEYRMLEVLMSNSGSVVSREDIMMRLWQTESFVDENTLTVNMTRLRKKLEQHGITDLIKTKKGMGYIIE
ncbi:MAG: response regulator transcription factor [Eubacteriaceae bacterium]|nr:response regulator transcription factor [Eubacteriaceae bacterium]